MKVGDYVRIDGYISKIEHIKTSSSDKIYAQWKQPNGMLASANIIIIDEFSPNIIDLIEVGDYVNGEQVSRIKQCPEYHLGDGILIFNEHNETIYSNFRTSKYYDIKSIVTKEQFESMEYKVKEQE